MDNFFLFRLMKNAGRTIIYLSYILFLLIFIGGIVTGIVISADMGYGSFDAILLGIVCGVVGGFILAFLIALPLKAFGTIVEWHELALEKSSPVLSKYQVTATTESKL